MEKKPLKVLVTEISAKEFLQNLKSSIKINGRNLALRARFSQKIDECEEDYDTTLLRALENSYRKYKKPSSTLSYSSEEQPSLKLDSGSSFILFVIKKKHLRDVIPDIELLKYKEVCCDMISKLNNCHEAHFGLAKLLTYEGFYDQAEQHLNIAISEEKHSTMYNMWLGVVKSLSVESKQQALSCKKYCNSNVHIDLIRVNQKNIEILWSLLNLSLHDYLNISEEIECPQHYASKIKVIDEYYGYLAWSEVLIRSQDQLNQSKSEELLLQLISLYPHRPEAYLKLWYQLYSTQNYTRSLEISEAAFLKLAESSGEYTVVINLNYARSLFKVEKHRSCFELLQMMYTQHSQYSVYLYHYGRLCIKSRDTCFLGSAIGALEECIRICDEQRHGCIFYWLMIGYLAGNDKVKAYKCAKHGISQLSNNIEKAVGASFTERLQEKKIVKKINEMKKIAKEMHIDMMNMEYLNKIIENFDRTKLEEAKLHCKNIMKFDPVEGTIFHARLIVAKGEPEKAISLLEKSMNLSSIQMKIFFLLVKLLKEQGQDQKIESHCKSVIKQCKNPMIPVQIWLKTHMIYIKCLLNNEEYEKAILVLKSLAQVQPSPFIPDLDYTKHLQFATSKIQLMRTTENLSPDSLSAADDIHQTILSRARLLNSRRNLSSLVIESDSDNEHISPTDNKFNSESIEIGSRAPEPLPKARLSKTPIGDAANTGFSVSISYKFLYLIGKISALHKICINDGYCAMHDFLNIHHYWMREGIESDERMQVKGQYWLGVLLYLKNEHELAINIFKEIMSMLFQLNLEKMRLEIVKYLREHEVVK